MPIPAPEMNVINWTEFEEFDTMVIGEYSFFTKVNVQCKNCGECICFFHDVSKNGDSDRLHWMVKYANVHWDINFIKLKNYNKEVLCQCLNSIGHISVKGDNNNENNDIWLLKKRNVKLHY